MNRRSLLGTSLDPAIALERFRKDWERENAIMNHLWPRKWIPRFPRAEKYIPFLRRFGHWLDLPAKVCISTRGLRIPLDLRRR